MTENIQPADEDAVSESIEEYQQDDRLTPADRMDLIANIVAEDADRDDESRNHVKDEGAGDSP